MGVEQLFKEVFPLIKARPKEKIGDLFNGQVVGVDISIWLHQASRLKDVVFCMVCKPPYKPHAFLDSIKNVIKI